MVKDILFTKEGYNFIDGNLWDCVEIKDNNFVLMNKNDSRIIVIKNAKPCYDYDLKVSPSVQEASHD